MINSNYGSSFDFTDVNGTKYILAIYQVQPFDYNNTVSHYILLFANISDYNKPIAYMDNSFNNSFNLIFWFVVSVSIVVFIVTLVLIYFLCKTVKLQLKSVESFFTKIIRRALFTDIAHGVNLRKLNQRKTGIEDLVEACKLKLGNPSIFLYHKLHFHTKNC